MHRSAFLAAVLAVLLASPDTALAYIGPGAGITVIGTAIAFIGVIVLTIVGFVWYPVKRLFAKMKERKNGKQAEQESPPT